MRIAKIKWDDMRSCPDIYEVFSGDFLLLSRRGISRETSWFSRSLAKKCKEKKTLCSTGKVCYTRSYFITFERVSENATFCPNQDKWRCPETEIRLQKPNILLQQNFLILSHLFFLLLFPSFFNIFLISCG